jgi:hypothetical protein
VLFLGFRNNYKPPVYGASFSNTSSSQPFSGHDVLSLFRDMGYVPGRSLSIFIGMYVVMNIILSSVSFRNFSPNTWFASSQFEMCEYVGNRTGTLSLVNMSIAILFAGRNNILIAVTGWSQTSFLTLHRWIASVAALQAFVHSTTYTVAYFEPGSGGASGYAAEAALPFYVSYPMFAPCQPGSNLRIIYCEFLSDFNPAACILFLRPHETTSNVLKLSDSGGALLPR